MKLGSDGAHGFFEIRWFDGDEKTWKHVKLIEPDRDAGRILTYQGIPMIYQGHLAEAPDWVREAIDKAVSIWVDQVIVACNTSEGGHDFKTLDCQQSNTLDQCRKCGWTRWD